MSHEQIAAALASLAKDRIDPDIQELLVRGNAQKGVRSGALIRAFEAAFKHTS